MFDTPISVVGNVLTAPEWRRTTKSNTLVANFRIASTSRRYDKENGRWIDGDTLRVRVVCWRRLAENVGASLEVGDPVVVTGRLYTRDWVDGENNQRITYELEASAVGHDLTRGRTRMFRSKPLAVTGVDTGEVLRGEPAEMVDQPIRFGDGIPDVVAEPQFVESPVADAVAAALAEGTLGELDKELDINLEEEEEAAGTGEPAARRTRRKRTPVPA